MSTHRAQIALSPELLNEIDQAVDPRKRSAFITLAAKAELRRMRRFGMLEEIQVNPAWKDEDHPELAEGSAEWVGNCAVIAKDYLTEQKNRRSCHETFARYEYSHRHVAW